MIFRTPAEPAIDRESGAYSRGWPPSVVLYFSSCTLLDQPNSYATLNNFGTETIQRTVPVAAVVVLVFWNRPSRMGKCFQCVRDIEVNSERLPTKSPFDEIAFRADIHFNRNKAILIHEWS